jgi:hypothetical protein
MAFVIRVFNVYGTIGWVGRSNGRGPRAIGSWRDAREFRTRQEAVNAANPMTGRFKGEYVQYAVELAATPPRATLIDALCDVVRRRLQKEEREANDSSECMEDHLATMAKRGMQLHEELEALARLTARLEAKLNELQVPPIEETRQMRRLISRAIECLGQFPRRTATVASAADTPL